MNNLIYKLDEEYTKKRINFIRKFCLEFSKEGPKSKYIFGNNIYTKQLVNHLRIDAIIDEKTVDKSYNNIPIISLKDANKDSMILVASGGQTQTILSKLNSLNYECLDYFAFYKNTNLPLIDVVFNEGFESCYNDNEDKFLEIYNRLCDEESKRIFSKIVNFRLSYEIEYLKGFSNNEKNQYWEPFLNLKKNNESFLDIGCYDAYTSLEFIKRHENYSSLHIFEPIPSNYKICQEKLKGFKGISFYKVALSDKKNTLNFLENGSGSVASEKGSLKIKTDLLDNIIAKDSKPTYIKMDVEGSELEVIKGAKNTIKKHHPKLAISIYHKPEDFFNIPIQILSIYEEYDLYIRHYTETIYETVMFFIPKKSK